MAEPSIYEQILKSYKIDPIKEFTNQGLGLGFIGNTEEKIDLSSFLKNGKDISSGNSGTSGTSGEIVYSPLFKKGYNEVGKPGETIKTDNQGLGSIFNSENAKTFGDFAKGGKAVVDIYTGLDNLFGQGAKDRKETKEMMKQSFHQNYAMNEETMQKFREDNKRFKEDRARITSSYMA